MRQRRESALERRLLNRIVFVNVDGPSHISLAARIEETSGILQRPPLMEGQLDDLLVGFARADAPVVRPDGGSQGRCFLPLLFLDDLGVRLVNQRAHPRQHRTSPVAELANAVVNHLRGGVSRLRAVFSRHGRPFPGLASCRLGDRLARFGCLRSDPLGGGLLYDLRGLLERRAGQVDRTRRLDCLGSAHVLIPPFEDRRGDRRRAGHHSNEDRNP